MMGVEAGVAAPESMRILFVTTGLKLGGAEQQIAALAQALVDLGHQVAIINLTSGCDVKLPPDTEVFTLDMRKTPLSMLRALHRAKDIVGQWRPDIIHAHMIHGNLFARVLRRLGVRTPLICSAHSAREGGRLRAMAYRATDRWCALTTHVSAAGRDAMIGSGAVRAGRIIVMPNGIDTARFAPRPSARDAVRQALQVDGDDIVLLSIGRLVQEKDHALLIRAFSDFHADEPRLRLRIAGDGPLRTQLQGDIDALQLESAAVLLGPRQDVADLLQGADIFVLSSQIEGMPLVIGEAMATGLPVVATDAAGVREMAGDLATVAPVGDQAALGRALRNAVSRLPTAPDACARYRERITTHFDIKAIAGRWLTQYKHLTEGI